MLRTDSLEKTPMLGKIDGRRRGRQRMSWLDSITHSMDKSLSKLWEWWRTGEPGVLQSMGSQRVGHDWVTELNWTEFSVSSFRIWNSSTGIPSPPLALFVVMLHKAHLISYPRMSDSLRPHESQHARPPCPSPTPRAHPNPCPLSQWCHPTISSSVIPLSCLQSFPASGSFPMSQFLTSGGQTTWESA